MDDDVNFLQFNAKPEQLARTHLRPSLPRGSWPPNFRRPPFSAPGPARPGPGGALLVITCFNLQCLRTFASRGPLTAPCCLSHLGSQRRNSQHLRPSSRGPLFSQTPVQRGSEQPGPPSREPRSGEGDSHLRSLALRRRCLPTDSVAPSSLFASAHQSQGCQFREGMEKPSRLVSASVISSCAIELRAPFSVAPFGDAFLVGGRVVTKHEPYGRKHYPFSAASFVLFFSFFRSELTGWPL